MSSDLSAILRRLKPQKQTTHLARRDDPSLSFVEASPTAGNGLLLDTTVYIDALKGRLPANVATLLKVRTINHSSVAIAELAAAFGSLDPNDPRTAAALSEIAGTIADIPQHRSSAPGDRVIIQAGIASATIARLQQYSASDRRRLWNDALLYFQAIDNGLTLLTRNIGDMDLLQQIVPSGKLALYRT